MEVNRPIMRYFGGKWMLAPWIIEHFPPHKIYVEPFGGSGSVLMRKAKASCYEVYNDLNSEIVNVFTQLRENPEKLEKLIAQTPWSREEYDEAWLKSEDPLDQARKTIFRSFAGFCDAATSSTKSGFRCVMSQGKPAARIWAGYSESIQAFGERLSGVLIENKPAIEVMADHDSTSTLHYVDPPYVHSTRVSKNSYTLEMNNAEHSELCDFLKSLKGYVVLSGYDSEIYDSLNWRKVNRIAYADGAAKRVETIWLNSALESVQVQKELF